MDIQMAQVERQQSGQIDRSLETAECPVLLAKRMQSKMWAWGLCAISCHPENWGRPTELPQVGSAGRSVATVKLAPLTTVVLTGIRNQIRLTSLVVVSDLHIDRWISRHSSRLELCLCACDELFSQAVRFKFSLHRG